MGRRAGTGNSLPRCSGVTGPDTDVARVAAGQRAMCFARRVAEPYGSTARTQSSSQSGRGGVVTPRPVAGLPTCFTSFADKTCKPCLFPSRSACPSRYKPRACHRDCAQERRRPYAAFGAAGPPPVVLLRSNSTSGLSLGAVFYLMRHADTDWPLVNGRHLVGAANDLAPLTDRGARQAEGAAKQRARPGGRLSCA